MRRSLRLVGISRASGERKSKRASVWRRLQGPAIIRRGPATLRCQPNAKSAASQRCGALCVWLAFREPVASEKANAPAFGAGVQGPAIIRRGPATLRCQPEQTKKGRPYGRAFFVCGNPWPCGPRIRSAVRREAFENEQPLPLAAARFQMPRRVAGGRRSSDKKHLPDFRTKRRLLPLEGMEDGAFVFD
jgi:hypothetical protein